MKTASLSFHLRVVSTQDQLDQACRVRATSYGHHIPEMLDKFSEPEEMDTMPGVIVLLCTDKVSGKPIASVRLQTNAFAPLLIEQSVQLPPAMAELPRADISRLSVIPGGDPLAKLTMMKACFMLCMATQTRLLIIGARKPSLARQYERLGFTNLYEDQRMVPLAYAGGIPHAVLVFDPTTSERVWGESYPQMHEFTFGTYHRDIQLFVPALGTAQKLNVIEAQGEAVDA